MKLKELLKGRDKLRKYDELKEWRDRFNSPQANKMDFNNNIFHAEGGVITISQDTYAIPNNIRKIFVDALEAEIKKLDEE